MKKILSLVTVFAVALAFTSCSSSDGSGDTTDPYKDPTYGLAAITTCATTGSALTDASTVIRQSSLSETQQNDLKAIFVNLVDNVIVPTYTSLADNTEDLENTLNGLTVSNITQDQINKACEDFAKAREQWERSEAFLGGAASDFAIDPTIDSWPLSRSALLAYFNGQIALQDADESILGFHALEFMLFRNGQPRKVAEFQGNDTYSGFESVTGAQELKYAQDVCTLLKQRTFQLQVAWEGAKTTNSTRVDVLDAAGLKYTVKDIGGSYGNNLKNAGNSSVSTFPTLQAAVEQLLSAEEGSAYAITNEVGTAKIANPFKDGKISYVESPYSYRSITDFQDNIRSVRNVWYGTTTGTPGSDSFYSFFQTNRPSVNNTTVAAFDSAIEAIGAMPAPFVKYCCTVWGKEFSEEEYSE